MTTEPDRAAGRGTAPDLTSFHVERAEAGDGVSLEWVVRRFSAVLLAQARYRIGTRLRAIVEPEDLVSEVWAVTLPRLGELGSREGRKTPVLLKFLTTTLLNRVNDLVKTEIKGPRGRRAALAPGSSSGALTPEMYHLRAAAPRGRSACPQVARNAEGLRSIPCSAWGTFGTNFGAKRHGFV